MGGAGAPRGRGPSPGSAFGTAPGSSAPNISLVGHMGVEQSAEKHNSHPVGNGNI